MKHGWVSIPVEMASKKETKEWMEPRVCPRPRVQAIVKIAHPSLNTFWELVIEKQESENP